MGQGHGGELRHGGDDSPPTAFSFFLAEALPSERWARRPWRAETPSSTRTPLKGAQLVEALDNVQLLDSISSMSEDQQSKIRSDLGKNLEADRTHLGG